MTDNTNSTSHMVYVSYDRCDDTVRYSFVSHLSALLRRKGMIISSSFVDKSFNESTENIKNFEVFVVVISEGYLSSAECLDELAHICQRNNEAVVVYEFYSISRSEMVERSERLRDLLPEGNYSADQVSRWTSAIKKTTDSCEPRYIYYRPIFNWNKKDG